MLRFPFAALLALLLPSWLNLAAATTPTWQSAGPMNEARYEHSLTLLPDGRVLALGGIGAGGYLSSAELFDPATGLWTLVGQPSSSTRAGHTATLLPTGKVLVVGGRQPFGGVASTHDLFDPATGQFSSADSSIGAMEGHAAVRLSSDQVWLIHRGIVWLYDAAADSWSLGPGPLPVGATGSAFLLAAERLGGQHVLVSQTVSGLEIHHLGDGSVSYAAVPGTLADGTYGLLRQPGGAVLATGHDHSVLVTGSGTPPVTPYPEHRWQAPVVDSALGPLLIGGFDANQVPLASTRFLASNGWQSGPVLTQARARTNAIRLADGRVLVSGGVGSGGALLAASEILGAAPVDPADLVLTPLFEETGFGSHRVRLKVRHNGLGSAAQGVALAVQLDPGLTLDSATPSAGSFDAAQSRWNLGTLAVGSSAELVVLLHFTDTAQAATLALNAQLSATAGNRDAGNDDARIEFRLRLPDVELSHRAAQVGSELQFTLDVLHTGAVSAPFSALETIAQLPAGLTFVAAHPSQGQFDPLNQRWSVGTLAPGASAQLLVRASVDAADQAAHFTHLAALWSSTPADAEPANNSAVAEIDYTPIAKPTALGGRAWFDVNGNGVEDAGEPGVGNQRVFLLAAGTPLSATNTDSDGNYRFSGLAAGFYQLQLGTPPNQNDGQAWLPSAQVATGDPANDNNLDGSQPLPLQDGLIRYPLGATVELIEGQQVLDVDAGLHRGVELSGRLWEEKESLGIEDVGEPGLVQMPVVLLRNGVEIARTTTDTDGGYRFEGIACQCSGTSFDLELQLPELGMRDLSPTGTGSDPTVDSDFETALAGAQQIGRLALAGIGLTEQRSHLDAGLRRGRVRGQVWNDLDGDGLRSSGEPPISGFRLVLINSIGETRGDAVTDQNGRYAIDNVVAGGYRLFLELPVPSSGPAPGPTRWDQGQDDSIDSDFAGDQPVEAGLIGRNRGFYSATPPDLMSNRWNDTVDAGVHFGTTISGRIWQDTLANGTREDNEAGLLRIELIAEFDGGTGSLRTTSLSDGTYVFEGLNCLCNRDRSVRLRFALPALHAPVPVNQGGDPQRDSDFSPDGSGQLVSAAVPLGANRQIDYIDAGLRPNAAEIRLRLWLDLDNNGLRGAGEPPPLDVPLALYRQGETTPRIQRTVDGPEVVFALSEAGVYRVAWDGAGGGARLTLANVAGNDVHDSDFDATQAQGNQVFSPWITLALGQSYDILGLGLLDSGGLLAAVADGNGQNVSLPIGVHQPDASAAAQPPSSSFIVTAPNAIDYTVYPALARTFTVLSVPPQPGRVLLGAAAGHPAIDPPNWRSHPLRPRRHSGWPNAQYYLSALQAVTFVVMQPQASGTASATQGTAMNTGSGGNQQLKAVGDYTAIVDVPAGAIEQPTELFLNRYAPGSGAAPLIRWPSGWKSLGLGLLWGASDGQALPLLQDASAALLADALPALADMAVFRYDASSETWQALPEVCPGRMLQPGSDAGSVLFDVCRDGWYALFVEGPTYQDGFEDH
jgi:hypothetical protein